MIVGRPNSEETKRATASPQSFDGPYVGAMDAIVWLISGLPSP